MKKILLFACIAAIACGDDDVVGFDAGPGMVDAGGSDVPALPDVGPGIDAGPGMTDAGPGMTDAGPGMTDAGPGMTDAGPGMTDAGPGMTDAGPGMTDAGPGMTDAGPAVGICDPAAVTEVTAVDGMVVTTTIDTSMATATPEALMNCGNELTGQIIVAVTIPGAEADTIVQISTDNPGTSMDVDTILDLRDVCGTEGTCFDDIDFANGNSNSLGTIMADGGDTVFALVSGFGAMDEGAIEVSVEVLGTPGGVGDPCDTVACQAGLLCGVTDVCETPEAPALTAAEVVRYDDFAAGNLTVIGLGVTGTDVNADADTVNLTFLDAAGDPVAFGMDTTLAIGFDALIGQAAFMEGGFLNFGPTVDFPAGVVSFTVSVTDSAGLESNVIMGTVTTGTPAAVGESCAFTTICDAALLCGDTDVCEAPEAAVLTAAEVVRYDDFGAGNLTVIGLGVTGTDANSDADTVNLTFLDAAGDPVAFGMDTTLDIGFDALIGQAAFTEAGFLNFGPTADFPAGVVSFTVSVSDAAGLESNVIMGTVTTGTPAAAGESCASTAICDAALTCNDMDICEAP